MTTTAPPVQRHSDPGYPPPHPFIQRHPFYARFVVMLEAMAAVLVAVGVIAALITWWSDISSVERRFWNESAIHFSDGTVAFLEGVRVLISWLGLAGSVVAISMVGRLLLSIEGHVMRSSASALRNDH